MNAFRPLFLAALFLGPGRAQAGAVIREPDAIYLEDFLARPVKILTTADTQIFYKSDLARYLGVIKKGQIVEVQAVAAGAYRVRGNAQQGQVAGWVEPATLSPLKAQFLESLRSNAARKAEVDALIARNEVAVNMTPEEVTRALGKPSRKTSRLDAAGRQELWEFVRYQRIPQEVTGYDVNGRLVTAITYVKVANGKLAVTFVDNLVNALEQSEGTLERDARVKIVIPPPLIAY